jgi:hypothetical protein
MMHLNSLLVLMASAMVQWQESGENPALFCYLIGWGTYLSLRSRAMAPIPVSQRRNAPCLNSSGNCSTASSM